MLARLSRAPASVSELARPLAISLPAVMQHLQALEASGLVRSEKKGRVRTCRLEPKALATAEALDRRAARALGRRSSTGSKTYLAEHCKTKEKTSELTHTIWCWSAPSTRPRDLVWKAWTTPSI